jgi:Ni,Fe-hydrogenase III large subunit
LGNDAAFAFGLAQFSRLREDWLRLAREAFGHRLMMDCVVPGGVAMRHRPGDQSTRLSRQCDLIEQ